MRKSLKISIAKLMLAVMIALPALTSFAATEAVEVVEVAEEVTEVEEVAEEVEEVTEEAVVEENIVEVEKDVLQSRTVGKYVTANPAGGKSFIIAYTDSTGKTYAITADITATRSNTKPTEITDIIANDEISLASASGVIDDKYLWEFSKVPQKSNTYNIISVYADSQEKSDKALNGTSNPGEGETAINIEHESNNWEYDTSAKTLKESSGGGKKIGAISDNNFTYSGDGVGLVFFEFSGTTYYEVSFDSDGGSSVEPMETDADGQLTKLPESTKSGYTLAGWYDGDKKISTSSKFTKDTTVKAKWELNISDLKFEKYTGSSTGEIEDGIYLITAKSNKGNVYAMSNTSKTSSSTYYLSGTEINVSDLPTVTDVSKANLWEVKNDKIKNIENKKYLVLTKTTQSKNNYYNIVLQSDDSNSWSFNSDGYLRYDSDYYAGYDASNNRFKNNHDDKYSFTLYKVVESPTVTFDASAAGATVTPDKIRTEKGGYLSFLPTASREGYTLVGWATAPEAEYIATGSDGTIFTEDTTVYADWDANEYEVSFDLTDGKGTMDSLTATFDEPLALTTPAVANYPDGYHFDKWVDSNDEDVALDRFAEGYDIADDLELKAVWVPNNYTVTFNLNGGKGTMSSLAATFDEPLALTTPAVANYPEGCHFDKWVDSNDEDVALDRFAAGYDITDDLELKAVWAPNYYTITYVVGDHGKTDGLPTSLYYGQAIPKAIATDKYSFDGWYDATPSQAGAKKVNTMPATDSTVYAKWSYSSGGGSSSGGSGVTKPKAAEGAVVGTWTYIPATDQWTFADSIGTIPVNTWLLVFNPYTTNTALANTWFHFNSAGIMETGYHWYQSADGNWRLFYLHESADGVRGRMYANEYTPDGNYTDANGFVYIGGVQQVSATAR